MSTIAEIVPPCKDGLDKKTLLDFYWKYFDLHSRQRMQMVNFYITISIVLMVPCLRCSNLRPGLRLRSISLLVL